MLNQRMDDELYTSVYHYMAPFVIVHSLGVPATLGEYVEAIPLVRDMQGIHGVHG